MNRRFLSLAFIALTVSLIGQEPAIQFTERDGNRAISDIKAMDFEQLGESLRLSTLTLLAYQEDGATLSFSSPSAFYNKTSKIITSSESINVQTEDKRFTISGNGWLYDVERQNLVISNNVISTLITSLETPSLDGLSEATRIRRAEISSKQFKYSVQQRQLHYSNSVTLKTDIELGLRGEELSAKLDIAGNIETLEAVGKVRAQHRLDGRDLVASSERLEYAHGAGTAASIAFYENCKWKHAGLEGESDRLSIDQDQKSIIPEGNARVTASSSSPGLGSWHAIFDEGSFGATGFELNGNIKSTLPGDLTLRCQRLHGRLQEGSGSISAFTGQGQCSLTIPPTLGGGALAGDKFEFATTARGTLQLEISGNPTWNSALYVGQADLMTLQMDPPKLIGKGAVQVTFSAPSPVTSSTKKQVPVIITSQSCELSADTGTFTETVAIKHPDWNATSDFLEIVAIQSEKRIDRITASGNVSFENLTGAAQHQSNLTKQSDSLFSLDQSPWNLTSQTLIFSNFFGGKRPDLEARDQVVINQGANSIHADYMRSTASPEMLELRGAPFIDSPSQFHLIGEANSTLQFDPKDKTLKANGPYTFELPINVLSQ